MPVTRIGIIGYGGFGRFLHQSWLQMPDVRVTAIADQIPDRNPGGDIAFYRTWTEMINDPDVDVVWIATPPDTHAPMACASMIAGKDVVIEKPLATNLQDAACIMELARTGNRIATVDYMLRFDPICRALARLTRDGVFGRLRHVDVENYAQDQGLPPEHWFWDKEQSGGILVEHGVHFFDLVDSLTDSHYARVEGLTYSRNPAQEDQVSALVIYEDGMIASHYHSFARPGLFERTSMRLNYDLADIDIEGWIPLAARFRAMVNRDTRNAIARQLPNCIITGDTPVPPLAQYTSGGVGYDIHALIEGEFSLTEDKQHIYADCVRAMLADVIAARADRSHKLTVPLQQALISLEIAVAADQSAQRKPARPPKPAPAAH